MTASVYLNLGFDEGIRRKLVIDVALLCLIILDTHRAPFTEDTTGLKDAPWLGIPPTGH